MDNLATTAALVAFLGLLVENIAERLFGPWLHGPKMVWATMGLAVALCVGLQVDGLALVVGIIGAQPALAYPAWISWVVTGLVVGSGSNLIHRTLNPSAKGPIPPPPTSARFTFSNDAATGYPIPPPPPS